MTLSISEAPSISVLLSCYNGERWLAEAIESVLGQTFKDFEFVIVDDGSKDSSAELIREFADRDSRIVVISKSNTGLADSLNVGIQRSRGEWIARIDADDICEPRRLELQIAKAREDSRLVFVGAGLLEIDESGRPRKAYRYPCSHGALVRNLVTARRFPPHSSAFFRASAVRSIGGYRARIWRAEDRDLWLRLAEKGRMAALEAPLVRVRKHAAQISHDEFGRRQRIDSTIAIASAWLRRHGIDDPVDANREVFESFREHVESRLEGGDAFALVDYISHAKSLFWSVDQVPASWLRAARYLLSRPRLLLRYVRIRSTGDATPRELAHEWMRRTCEPRAS